MTRNTPRYNDGCFDLYQCLNKTDTDYPEEYLHNCNMQIAFREGAVFDRLRNDLSQSGKQVTMKILIPRYKVIDSTYYAEIDGVMHHVYNAAHVFSKDGFPETELTLITPEHEIPKEAA